MAVAQQQLVAPALLIPGASIGWLVVGVKASGLTASVGWAPDDGCVVLACDFQLFCFPVVLWPTAGGGQRSLRSSIGATMNGRTLAVWRGGQCFV